MKFLSRINWYSVFGLIVLPIVCICIYFLIGVAVYDYIIGDGRQTKMECLKSHGIYLESDRVCVTQQEAYAMVERWPNYGGWGK